MPKNTPAPEFSALRPTHRLKASTVDPSSDSENSCPLVGDSSASGEIKPVTTFMDAKSLVLGALLPEARKEAIKQRNILLRECDPHRAPPMEFRWLLRREARDWRDADWLDHKGGPYPLGIPKTDNPTELDSWLLAEHPDRIFEQGWERKTFLQEGWTACTEMYADEPIGPGPVRNPWFSELTPPASWIWHYLERLMSYAEPAYKDPMFVPYMKALWPDWADPNQVWLAGGSDLMGDRLVLLVGTGQQMLKTTPSFVLAKKLNGMEAGLLVNTWFDQLSPVQAALLIPGTLKRRTLLRL